MGVGGSCRAVACRAQGPSLVARRRLLPDALCRGAAEGCCAALARWAVLPPPEAGLTQDKQELQAATALCWRAAAAATVAAALLSGLERSSVHERLGCGMAYRVAVAGAAILGPAFDSAANLQCSAPRYLPLAAKRQTGRMLLAVLEAGLGAAEQALRFRSSMRDAAGLSAALDRTVFKTHALAHCFKQAAVVLYVADTWTSGGTWGAHGSNTMIRHTMDPILLHPGILTERSMLSRYPCNSTASQASMASACLRRGVALQAYNSLASCFRPIRITAGEHHSHPSAQPAASLCHRWRRPQLAGVERPEGTAGRPARPACGRH